jgi:hypothetical protein
VLASRRVVFHVASDGFHFLLRLHKRCHEGGHAQLGRKRSRLRAQDSDFLIGLIAFVGNLVHILSSIELSAH